MIPVLLIPFLYKGGARLLPMHLVIMVACYITLAQSWNVLSGLTGMFSLGHASFYGLGGYALAVAMMKFKLHPLVGLAIGIVLAAAFGLLIGMISSKLTGFYFTMSTIALAQVLHTIAIQWTSMTNSINGVKIFRPIVPRIVFFYTAIAMAVAVSIFFVYLRRSRVGSMFVAIRENANLARSLGVNVIKYKTLSSVIAASIAAVVGSFSAYYVQVVDTTYLSTLISQKVIMVTIIGGLGHAWGPIFGAVLILIEETVRGKLGARYAPLATATYGIILIVFMIWKPNGIVSINLKRSFNAALSALTPTKNMQERK
jgi:branched-chain amino acid transport system permease protein